MNFITNRLCQSYSILLLQHESRHRQHEANGQSCVPYNFIYKNRHLAHSSLLTTGLESKLCYIKTVMVSTYLVLIFTLNRMFLCVTIKYNTSFQLQIYTHPPSLNMLKKYSSYSVFFKSIC